MRRVWGAASGLGVAALLLIGAPGVCAQDWPTRPIKIVSPLAPGGAVHAIGQAVGDAFSVATKLPVILDHRPGGGGTLAAVTVARAELDVLAAAPLDFVSCIARRAQGQTKG